MRSKKYPILNDQEWLREQYELRKRSLTDIAQEVGCRNHNSVRQALKHAGIAVRNISEGLRAKLMDDFILNLPVIEGSLLGDGMLRKYNKQSSQSYPAFRKKNKYLDHVRYVASLLFRNPDDHIHPAIEKFRGHNYQYFRVDGNANKELLPIYRRWYPCSSGFVKVVPKDFKMDRLSLLHWFLDDGSTSYRVRNGRITSQVRITFCSESFSKEDQEFLVRQLTAMGLSTKMIACQWGTGYRINIRQSSASKFFEIIGPPPIQSMAYKWKTS